MLKSVTTDLSRLQEIARVVVRHGYGHLAARNIRLSRAVDASAVEDQKPSALSSADRFVALSKW